MGAGSRRRARWYALQVLYALDLNPAEDTDSALGDYAEKFAIAMEERALEFARELVKSTMEHRIELDETIQEISRNWRLDRMSRVDRNILRLATCELMLSRDVPVKVVINEAVELAKRFGTGESPAFVNGILDRVAQNVRG